jgi:thiol-disulfide isomerase/thioredoxin
MLCRKLLLALLLALPALAAEEAKIELSTVDFAKLDAAIKDRKGKVVLVDVWATTCGPCRKKFPGIVALHEKYKADGLAVMTVSTDEADEAKAALEFLQEKKATMANFRLQDTEANEKKYAQYPIFPQPMLWLFDREGKKVLQDEGKLKPEELEAKVKELLGK